MAVVNRKRQINDVGRVWAASALPSAGRSAFRIGPARVRILAALAKGPFDSRFLLLIAI
jgi:hypothetical protein